MENFNDDDSKFIDIMTISTIKDIVNGAESYYAKIAMSIVESALELNVPIFDYLSAIGFNFDDPTDVFVSEVCRIVIEQ